MKQKFSHKNYALKTPTISLSLLGFRGTNPITGSSSSITCKLVVFEHIELGWVLRMT